MQEATMAEMGIAMGEAQGDETLFVRVFTKTRENQAKSKELGRPIFEEVPYMEIRPPGEKDNIVVKPVDEKLKQRFPRHWAAFEQRKQEVLIEGTPLDQWPQVTRAQAEELKFFKVFTVEQLASMADSNVSGFMGLADLKSKAQAFLETAGDNATAQALAEAKAENIELRGQISELADRLAALESKPKRGRPRKEQSDGDEA